MIKDEKKKYPSELNTKSIACRIPMGDYVEIMNECVAKGITINDWLLMKLYSKNGNQVLGSQSDDHEDKFPEFTIETERGEFVFNDVEDVEATINFLIKENILLLNKVRKISNSINLDDEGERNRVFNSIIEKINSNKWENVRHKIDCRRDFKEIWKELFD